MNLGLFIILILTISLFIHISQQNRESFIRIFLISFISTSTFSLFCYAGGTWTANFLFTRKLSIPLFYTSVMASSILAAILANYMSKWLSIDVFLLANSQTLQFILNNQLLPSIGLTIIISYFVTRERFRPKPRPEQNSETLENKSREGFIYIMEKSKKIKILEKDIYYLSVQKQYTLIHIQGGEIRTRMVLKKISEMLSFDFVRIHRSFIINTKYISKLENTRTGYLLYLQDEEDTSLPVGRSYLAIVKQYISH